MPLQDDLAQLGERELIQRVADGSTEALAVLFALHSPLVHRVAYRLTMSGDDAEDVVQDVFIGLPEAVAGYTGSSGFASWLRRVTVRTVLMRMRSRRRREASANRAIALRESTQAGDELVRIAIADALASLPDDLRVVFVLSEVEGYAHAEISNLLGISIGTSHIRLHRARRKLRTLLEEI